MKISKYLVLCVTLFALFVGAFVNHDASLAQSQTEPVTPPRENAYRLNNIGVALLEQFKYQEAADAFRRALQIEPKLTIARINLSIALFNVPDLAAAAREAQAVSLLAPNAPQPSYILALIAKTQSRVDEAMVQFQKVLKIDPNDVGANVNLGQLYSQQRKYPEAIAAFRLALAAEPYNATALYNLGQALVRSGQREEGLKATARFQELRQKGSATTLGTTYLEQGRYAEAVASTGAEPELVDRNPPTVTFTLSKDASGLASSMGPPPEPVPMLGRQFTNELNDDTRRQITTSLNSGATLFDFDNDGDLDLFQAGATGQRLYRNDRGTFNDTLAASSPALMPKPEAITTGAIAGDYDNDGNRDLLVIRNGGLNLYHNEGGARFLDATASAGIPSYPYLASTAAFLDVDHDGDLDIFVAGFADLSKTNKAGPIVFPDSFPTAPNLLLRNDGLGKFTDITIAAGLNTAGHAVAVVPTDFNNRRDIDLVIVSFNKPIELFSNQRDGTFRNVAKDVGLDANGRWTCAAAGDVNKDGYTDFFFGRTDGPGLFALSDGKEKFNTSSAPAGTQAAQGAQFLDYDNDGLLDCLMTTERGLRVFRNVGNGWSDETDRALGQSQTNWGRSFVAGDYDNDGDEDLIVVSPHKATFARNEGGNRHNALLLNLSGKVSNRTAVGTKIEIRAGSLIQKIETSVATPAVVPVDVLFGLGKRSTVDAVRLLWPSGVVQAETEIVKSSFIKLPITELDRKPSSCPYLYTWNGERFEFITDFMGGGEMGYLEEPGRHNKPDPIEYVRIGSDQLKERNGTYEVRVTNELEEALFADQFQLIAVDHPSTVDVYPNEGMTDPPRPFRLFVTRDARPPLSATDEHGHDVLSRITKMDRTYPDDFKRDRIRGYADEHTLTLKLATQLPDRIVLLLTGWTDYAWSSDNLAAAQARKAMKLPALQVKNAQGNWQTVIEDIGIPVGRPQTVTVDLTGKFLTTNREVRIVTNMRILWDQILIAPFEESSTLQLLQLDPLRASLRWRGFSREATPDGREPFGYDYQEVSFVSPWKVMPGRYTREGDVRELLLNSDDMFVISLPGDEMSLSFDARKLPPLKPNWTRTFLLYSDGYSKEMDINSAIPDQVWPLPFHGMSRYPYPNSEAYPMTSSRRAYIERYNTRVVKAELPSINSLIAVRVGQ